MPPQAFVERVFAAAQEWAPVLHDDVVVLALRRAPELELRDEPATGAAAQALYGEYMALVRERLGPGFVPEESIFATERVFEEERAAFVVLYARGRAVGCGGVRSLGPELAEIKRMFVTADARGRGHGRLLLAELERRAAAAGATRVRLLTTEALTEALALYESAGYAVVEVARARGPARHLARAPPGVLGPPQVRLSPLQRLMPSPVEPPGPRWEIAWHEHDRAPHPAPGPRGRALRRPGVGARRRAGSTRDDLQDEIDVTRAAYTTAAVTEIASLRSRPVGPAGWVASPE